MKKVLLTLATLTLSVLIGGDLTIYASDIESENSVLSTYRNEQVKYVQTNFFKKMGMVITFCDYIFCDYFL